MHDTSTPWNLAVTCDNPCICKTAIEGRWDMDIKRRGFLKGAATFGDEMMGN